MTEFNPLLGKSKIEVSYAGGSSEHKKESLRPLLREKNFVPEEEVRFRPKSMSMLARSNYASSNFQSSSKTLQTGSKQLQSGNRPTSLIETSSDHTFVTETRSESLFVKSFEISAIQNQKVVERSSKSSISVVSNDQVVHSMSSSEPLYIQELEPPGVAPTSHNNFEIADAVLPSKMLKSSPLIKEANSETSSSSDEDEKEENNDDSSSVTSRSSEDPKSDSHSNDSPTPILNPEIKSYLGRQPIIPGVESTIEINKGIHGLGINVIGGANTLLNFIHVLSVEDQGAAAKDGRLWPGDRILSANNSNLRSVSHEEAIDVIQNSPSPVRLVIFRDAQKSKAFLRYQKKIKIPTLSYWDTINNEKESDVYDIYDVKFKKKQNQSLGLCITGRRNDPGVFITDVTVGSVAAKDGRIRKGDQILAINGKDMKIASQEVAAQLVHNSQGEIHVRMGRLKSGVPNDLMYMPVERNDDSMDDPHLTMTSIDRERKHTRFVEIKKPFNAFLGIYIAGGIGSPLGDVPVFVALIEETKIIGDKLKVGDIILSVNGQSTEKKTHDEVVAMMSTTEDMIILMQVQDPTEEISKLTSYLNQAVHKHPIERQSFDLDNAPKTLEHSFSIQPGQIETMIY